MKSLEFWLPKTEARSVYGCGEYHCGSLCKIRGMHLISSTFTRIKAEGGASNEGWVSRAADAR
jgi:hypothetical protein